MTEHDLIPEDDYPVEDPDDGQELDDDAGGLDPDEALDGSEDSIEDPPNDDAGMAPEPMPHAVPVPEVE